MGCVRLLCDVRFFTVAAGAGRAGALSLTTFLSPRFGAGVLGSVLGVGWCRCRSAPLLLLVRSGGLAGTSQQS